MVRVESTPKKAVLSLLPSLDSWKAAVVYVIVNWGLPWAGVGFISVSLLVLRPSAQRSSWWVRDGVEVRAG